MSHFSLLVIKKPEQLKKYEEDICNNSSKEYKPIEKAISKQLRPFDEDLDNPEGRYFEDCTEELNKRWLTETVKMVKVNGKLESIYSVKKYDPSKILEVSIQKLYSSKEDFAKVSYDYNIEKGIYGYWGNNMSKWDWYKIGGRWSGSLRLKPNATTGTYGERSLSNRKKVIPENLVDSAKFSDIDFSMNKKDYKGSKRFWELYIDKEKPLNEEEEEILTIVWHKEKYYTERYKDKEEYAKRQSLFNTFAILTADGKWYEAGSMGWFGCSSESPEEGKNWELNYMDLLNKNANNDDIITIVDCHI